ncbi:unnamed protein product [Orchesella dallaii]|uniref:Uncharacterized protein n=1 Tax=Orchesella dallaii TaxID=48710 RepID=A0ABP1Q9C4_9HEXA
MMISSHRKKSKPPIKQKEDVAKFIESYEARRQCASSSGAVIEKQIKRYQVKTGAKVFFKSYFPFKGTGGAVFKVGEDFRLPDDKVPETFLDYEKKIVKTIADSFTTVIRDVRFGTPSDPRPGPSSSVTIIVLEYKLISHGSSI